MFLIFIKKFSLVLFGLLMALIVLEISIRVLLSFLPENLLPTYGIYQKSYPVIGHKLLPNLNGVWSREGFSRVKTNSMGWNDYERNVVKPLNTIRIAIVGDSFIEALQVDKSKAVGQITELWLEENCNNFFLYLDTHIVYLVHFQILFHHLQHTTALNHIESTHLNLIH